MYIVHKYVKRFSVLSKNEYFLFYIIPHISTFQYFYVQKNCNFNKNCNLTGKFTTYSCRENTGRIADFKTLPWLKFYFLYVTILLQYFVPGVSWSVYFGVYVSLPVLTKVLINWLLLGTYI